MSYHNYTVFDAREIMLPGDHLPLGSIEAMIFRKQQYDDDNASLVTVHERSGRHWLAHQTLDYRLIGVCPQPFRSFEQGLLAARAQSTALPHVKELFVGR